VTRSLDGSYNIGNMARNVDFMLNNSAKLTETLLGMVRESHPLVLDTLNNTKRTISSVSRLIERPTISLG
jgi:hypothetical protein